MRAPPWLTPAQRELMIRMYEARGTRHGSFLVCSEVGGYSGSNVSRDFKALSPTLVEIVQADRKSLRPGIRASQRFYRLTDFGVLCAERLIADRALIRDKATSQSENA